MRSFARYAWFVLGFNLLVILWGAYVRATGSGAGCGRHWPHCQGALIPRSPARDTMIEYTHRLSSGLAFVMVVLLAIIAFRRFAPGNVVRKAAVASALFMVIEALVGAALVLLGLVATNTSIARAWVMSAHLINTFLLLGAIALTAWWSSVAADSRPRLRGQAGPSTLLLTGLGATMVLGVSGAVTALGDSLFPAASLAAGISDELSSTAHLFVRLRVLHPILAVAVGIFLMTAVSRLATTHGHSRRFRRLGIALAALFGAQLLAGVANVLLLAPVWMQMLHLLLADLNWVVLVLLAATVLEEAYRAVPETAASTERPVASA